MNDYLIVIEEVLAKEFKVSAHSAEDAFRIAKERYKTGDFVLHPGEVHSKRMAILDSTNNEAEWFDF